MNTPQHNTYILIPHPNSDAVLLLQDGDQWTLPRLSATDTGEIRRAIQEQLGLDVTVLDDNLRFKNILDGQHSVYAVDNHSRQWSPPENARWMGRSELAAITLTIPEHRALLESWFDEIEQGNIPAQRVPWARMGWFDEATAWVEEQVARLGYTVVAPIEQVHVRIWSTVLRISTTSGVLYFKAVASGFACEPALTQFLSEHWPDSIPCVLAIDREHRWMLMRDAGSPLRTVLVTEDASINRKYLEEALTLYASFQSATMPYTGTLLALGCPDRRLHLLPQLFEQLIADSSVLLIGQKGGITEAELEQLRNFTPRVREMCEELASYRVPETLHHDDFHTNNILINERGYVFFDWGDSAVTHPFCSLFAALRSAKYRLSYDENALLRLRDAYLEPWIGFASHLTREQLLAAFSIAQRLGMLSRVLTWYQVVSPLEERMKRKYEAAFPYWLRMFLTNKEPDER